MPVDDAVFIYIGCVGYTGGCHEIGIGSFFHGIDSITVVVRIDKVGNAIVIKIANPFGAI